MTIDARAARVVIALQQMLPDACTWTEECSDEWRAAFPCGIKPQFVYSTVVTVCPDQVATAGESLTDWDFESLLDALIEWVFLTSVAYIDERPVDEILGLLADSQPVNDMVLKTAAATNDMTLTRFLGADRAPYMHD